MGRIMRLSILSGILVGVGIIVNTSLSNKYVGSMLFSVALLSIVKCDLYLYTGKIGFIGDVSVNTLIITFLGNLCGVTLSVLLFTYKNIELAASIKTIANQKFTNTPEQLLICGCMCGVLMFIAVYSKSEIVIVFAVMTFILSGYEHCIADFPYLLINYSAKNLIKFSCIVLGNTIGAIFTSRLLR